MDYTQLPAIVSLNPNQQKSWVAVGEWKSQLAKSHELKSLELQKLLLNPGTTIVEIENTLGSYRKLHQEMTKDGQQFRALIDEKVLQQSLTIEKEYSPKVNENYLLAEKSLTTLKLKAESDAKSTQAKAQEKLNYATHIKNEYLTVSNELRQAAVIEMNTMYVSYLKGNVKNPDIEAIKATIRGMQPRKYVMYNKQYVTDPEATIITQGIPRPDYNAIREEMVALVDEKFKSYAHDLKANTVEQVEAAAQEEIKEIAKETAIEVGVNTMSAQANVPEIIHEGKALKRLLECVVEGGEQWHINVISAYLKNPLCRSHITVKAWENLTVKQMAAALGKYASETGDVDPNLQYREIVK